MNYVNIALMTLGFILELLTGILLGQGAIRRLFSRKPVKIFGAERSRLEVSLMNIGTVLIIAGVGYNYYNAWHNKSPLSLSILWWSGVVAIIAGIVTLIANGPRRVRRFFAALAHFFGSMALGVGGSILLIEILDWMFNHPQPPYLPPLMFRDSSALLQAFALFALIFWVLSAYVIEGLRERWRARQDRKSTT